MQNVTLYRANDILPHGLQGTPWEGVFLALSSVLRSALNDSENAFIYLAGALHYLAQEKYSSVTRGDVLDALAYALAIPAWVSGRAGDDEKRQAVLSAWLSYRGTTEDFVGLITKSGASSVDFTYSDDGKVTCKIGSIASSIFYTDADAEPVARFFDRVRAFLPIAFGSTVELVAIYTGYVYLGLTNTLRRVVYDDEAETVEYVETGDVHTYEVVYSEPSVGIIRSEDDANMVAMLGGNEFRVLCDRKWGEYTPSGPVEVTWYATAECDISSSTNWPSSGSVRKLYVYGDLIPYADGKTYEVFSTYRYVDGLGGWKTGNLGSVTAFTIVNSDGYVAARRTGYSGDFIMSAFKVRVQ